MAKLSLKNFNLEEFLNFLIIEKYEIKLANPKHIGGQGYSPAAYYSNVDLGFVLRVFIEQKNNLNIECPNCRFNKFKDISTQPKKEDIEKYGPISFLKNTLFQCEKCKEEFKEEFDIY